MKQDCQQKKQLPRRTSRGVRVQQSQQQKKQDDELYNTLFGNLNDSSESSDQSFSKQLGLKPLQTFTANFANYNYGRGYHYFFNLDTFQRVQGSPSYALDDINRFNHKYSHDQQVINGTKIKNLINRKLVGLPITQTTYSNKKSQDKNVCHYHLFNVEDKKYHNHRLISKYRYVLKNLEHLQASNKIKTYTQLKKDVVMHQVCQKNTSIQRKQEVLQNRIKVLEERVSNMSPYWSWQDDIYYNFSLDQVFHNQAMLKGQKLSQKYLSDYIIKRIVARKQFLEGIQMGQLYLGIDKIRDAIESWVQFEQQQQNALSTLMQNRLKAMPKIIQMFRRKQQLIIFPLFTFNFGSKQIQRAIDSLIKAKLQKSYESCFYVYKAFVKRLLKRDLACQQEQMQEPMLIEQYTKLMKQKIVFIEDFYKKQIVSHKKISYVDEIVQLEKIQSSPIQEKVLLLQPGHKIQIYMKDLILLFFYRNISIALQQFIEYLKYDPQVLKLMADSNYQKFHYGIAKIIHQPQFCILINDITRFAQILSSTNISLQMNDKFYFSFNESLRIAYVWKQAETDDWQTQKDEDEKEEEIEEEQDSMRNVFQDGDPQPRKKLKFQQ